MRTQGENKLTFWSVGKRDWPNHDWLGFCVFDWLRESREFFLTNPGDDDQLKSTLIFVKRRENLLPPKYRRAFLKFNLLLWVMFKVLRIFSDLWRRFNGIPNCRPVWNNQTHQQAQLLSIIWILFALEVHCILK